MAVVHNGIIENYTSLKRQLLSEGVTFVSDTDTEVVAHLIAQAYRGDLSEAVASVLPLLKGTYGLAVLCPREPETMIVARLGSPLVLGMAGDQVFVASDPNALSGLADRVIYLEDQQLAVLSLGEWQVLDRHHKSVFTTSHSLEANGVELEKGPLSPLHAQGDPRATRDIAKRPAGSFPGVRGNCSLRRTESRQYSPQAGGANHYHRLWDELLCRHGGRIPLRGVCPDSGRGGIRLGISLSQSAH